jgi:MscS family membrane protein
LTLLLLLHMMSPSALAQLPPRAEAPAAPARPPDSDALGRDTPRGTVVGFLKAARAGDYALASAYIDGRPSADLAHQLFVVLDVKLPARLTEISDRPEGARTNPLIPDRELVGTIDSRTGPVDVTVERVRRGTTEIWLFPATMLGKVPTLYEEVNERRSFIPGVRGRPLAGFTALEWLLALGAISLFFAITAMLDRLLVAAVGMIRSRRSTYDDRPLRTVLPVPARLLLLAGLTYWLLTVSGLSLFVRQFWSNAAIVMTIVAIVWLLILLNGVVAERFRRRKGLADHTALAALSRIMRRVIDVVFVVIGLAALLRQFDIDPTPALAGLGVGGIAVALAAQKTLENVIAGASLIVDQAVRVGDVLKVGEVTGVVDHIGLRSTRIRTLDRTMVRIPNGQIATATVETLSARDKFWFHPEVRLRPDTTPAQVLAVVSGLRTLLEHHPSVDPDLRVRFHRLGTYSLDIEVFAYVFAHDLNEFLKIQEKLLIEVTEVIERSGSALALPPSASLTTPVM